MSPKPKILLVEDDPQSMESMKKILLLEGHDVSCARDGDEALRLIRNETDPFDLVVSDIRMPKMSGLELFRATTLLSKEIPFLLMTAFGRIEDAVWAMKLGAVDFLTKPFRRKDLVRAVQVALRSRKLLSSFSSDEMLIGSSAPILELRETIRRVGPTEVTVLITGESGVGKEIAARSVHQLSRRVNGPFVGLNCAAIPDALMESELFGYEKGAFSGAVQGKIGLFEAANGGTLFLDEIGDMPVALQAKLLRTLQDKEVRRLGATQTNKIDVRLISASHRNLKQRVREGLFREDLLFRLDVVQLGIAPLRERKEDILELSQFFISESSQRHEKRVSQIDDQALRVLYSYHWPGNVRELANVLERAVIFSEGGTLTLEALPQHLQKQEEQPRPRAHLDEKILIPLGTPLKEVEDLLIRRTLEATGGDKTMTAKLLGINSRTIYRRLEKGP